MVKRDMKIIDWSELEGRNVGHFKPEPHYDEESDCFTLFISDAESKRERVDRYLTVYRSIDTGEVTGCHVKDVKKVFDAAEAFQIDINTDDVSLGLLLMAVPWTELNEREEPITIHARAYREVVDAVGKTRVAIPKSNNDTCTC